MKKVIFVALMAVVAAGASAQNVSVKQARFHKGDDMSWAKPETPDGDWSTIDMTKNWDDQGIVINNGYAWYRVHVMIPKSILNGKSQQQIIVINTPKADDTDECYWVV